MVIYFDVKIFLGTDEGEGNFSVPVVFVFKIDIINFVGQVPKRPTGADCKSAGFGLREFESLPAHQIRSERNKRRVAFLEFEN